MALPVRPVVLPAVLRGRTNGQLPNSILVDTPGQKGGPTVRLVPPAARCWRAMCAKALSAGHILKMTSLYDSYRPLAIQERIFLQRYQTEPIPGQPTKRWRGAVWYKKHNVATAAVPGTSNHGLALAGDIGEERDGDIGTESIDQATVNWLVAHAHEFGFSAELQSEPWHWRCYIGDQIPAAVLAYEQGGDLVTTQAEFNRFLRGALGGTDADSIAIQALLRALPLQYPVTKDVSLLSLHTTTAAKVDRIAKEVNIDEEELAAIEARVKAGVESSADAFVAAVVALLPAGSLTKGDVEAAVRSAFERGLAPDA